MSDISLTSDIKDFKIESNITVTSFMQEILGNIVDGKEITADQQLLKNILNSEFKSVPLGGIDLDDKFINKFNKKETSMSDASTVYDYIPLCSEVDEVSNQELFYVPLVTANGIAKIFIEQREIGISSHLFEYDFFGSGKFYVNLNENQYIVGIKPEFGEILRKYFFHSSQTDFTLSEYPYSAKHFTLVADGHEYSAASSTSTNSEVQNQYFSYTFIALQCFVIKPANELHTGGVIFPPVQNVATNKKNIVPICKYFSFCTNSENDFLSDEYKFANHIPGVKTCSSPKRTAENGTVAFCPFKSREMTNCDLYEPIARVISKAAISPKNTSNSIIIDMIHSYNASRDNLFIIRDKTNNIVINSLMYPKDIEYKDALKEATAIFDEYISCYVDHDVDTNPSSINAEIQKSSFIQKLLEV